MELYSKRSALGCPFPAWIVVWHLIAVFPAVIHSAFAGLRRSRERRKVAVGQSEHASHLLNDADHWAIPLAELPNKNEHASSVKKQEEEAQRKKNTISAVQGADEDWPVQLAWAVYCMCPLHVEQNMTLD